MKTFVKVIISVLVLAAIGCGVYFGFFHKPVAEPTVTQPAVVEVVETETPDELVDETYSPEAVG